MGWCRFFGWLSVLLFCVGKVRVKIGFCGIFSWTYVSYDAD